MPRKATGWVRKPCPLLPDAHTQQPGGIRATHGSKVEAKTRKGWKEL